MAFFSGTDLNTLRDEGSKQNHFVSLIVNNEGKYVAAITKQLKGNRDITEVSSFNSFEDKKETNVSYFREEVETLEYSMLNILKEEAEVPDVNYLLDERIEEILERKRKEKEEKRSRFQCPSLFRDYMRAPFTRRDWDLDYPYAPQYERSKETLPVDYNVQDIVMQLITGSITVTRASKINPHKWARTMVPLFRRRFKDLDSYDFYISSIIEFVMSEQDDDEYDPLRRSALAEKLIKELERLPSNEFINKIMYNLTMYLE